MIEFQLIPAIDIIDGQLVRLVQGDYDQKTVYTKSPVQMAEYYQSLDLSHIHVVDLNGAADGKLTNLDTIQSIANIDGITIQVGGGIRSLDHANSLFDAGVSFIILGSIVTENFSLARDIISHFPNQVIVGLDLKDGKISTHGWKNIAQQSLSSVLKQLKDLPVHSILSTDISRDGTFQGVNAELYRELSLLTNHSLIASGGVSSIENIYDLVNLSIPNLKGCVVGKAIIEQKIDRDDIQDFLAE